MVKETDILYLSKEDTETLDDNSQLQAALKTTLTSTSNKEILTKLMDMDVLMNLTH